MTEDNRLPLERWQAWRRKIPYGKVGFGYMVDPEDSFHIIPNPTEIIVLEQAFDFIDKGSSWREVSEWVSQKLLRSIVHQTISNLYKKHRKPFLNRKTLRKPPRAKLDPETQKLANAKRDAALAIKRAKKLEAEIEAKKNRPNPDRVDGRVNNGGWKLPPDPSLLQIPPVPKEVSFVFTPNKGPQTDFLSASEEEVLYGGSAGGEPKSWFNRLLF